MRLDKLREIAGKRTGGQWSPCIAWNSENGHDTLYPDALNPMTGDDMVFIGVSANHIDAMLDVAEAALILIGPSNIGKTVDINLDWSESDISVVITGKALQRLVLALNKLEKI